MRMPKQWKLTVALALGGGAARGVAHVGVLRALERAGIRFDLIVGTSMGAIIGGAYAALNDAERLESRVREVLSSEEFRKNRLSFLRETKRERSGLFFSVSNLVRKGIFFGVSNMRPSFLSAEEFASSIAAILPQKPIEELPLEFAAVALDLERAEEVVIRSGDVRHAANASSAIPGVLPPVPWNGRRLIDGGWVDKIPVLAAFRLGADVVIGVDISAEMAVPANYRRGVDIMMRANSIKDFALVSYARRLANVVVVPDVGHVHWADFGAYDHCIEAGDAAATESVPAIKELLRQERLFSIVRPGQNKRTADMLLRAGGLPIVIE